MKTMFYVKTNDFIDYKINGMEQVFPITRIEPVTFRENGS